MKKMKANQKPATNVLYFKVAGQWPCEKYFLCSEKQAGLQKHSSMVFSRAPETSKS